MARVYRPDQCQPHLDRLFGPLHGAVLTSARTKGAPASVRRVLGPEVILGLSPLFSVSGRLVPFEDNSRDGDSMKRILTAAAVAGVLLTGAPATPAIAHASHSSVAGHHHCTRTSSGSCIRGGEFCKQSQYGQVGYDAHGRKYVCKGSHTHPHWEIP